ncbi:uncharacterized protein LOC110465888 isoform X2 [Mizuhopecten yessoensis]|uniref:Uncharacterized protein n=1 Tax=Mizuhopecten yessoensis TaxID=6573 RepID=A0A210PQN7_MIZYE|nr:uncharacterized protein LOC110465888 isoform X2 [Mizuhopecten yessoensis]OWF38791.1 hypothetical protein KP79_PYT16675 [Mizuhopecten yessoensis]
MAKGNKPGSSQYKETANNTKTYNHGNDIHNGASGGDSEEQDNGRREMAGAPTFQGRRRSDKQQETLDLTKAQFSKDSRQTSWNHNHHQKKSKVLPSRQDFNGSVQQSYVSPATPTPQDLEEDGDLDCKDTEDQLIGVVYTENVLIAQETQSPKDQERSDELVCVNTDTYYVTNILPSSKNHEEIVQSMCFQKNIAVKHKERLTRTEECGHCENGFHATVRHDFPSQQAKGRTVFEQCKQKVGLVRCLTCGNWGTCFRIGKCNIATCWHVISKCTDHPITAVFYYQGPNQQDTWVYRMGEKYIDKNLDFAICELCNNDKSFPPAFTKFRHSTHADGCSEGLVYLTCFQKDATDQIKLDVHCDTVRLNSKTLDDDRLYNLNLMAMEKYPNNTPKNRPYGDANLHRDNGHVPLLCKVTHGGSGGVGVSLDGNGYVVVDFMYRRGFPGFFYETNTETALTTDEKEEFPGCLRMEVGFDIRTMIRKSGQGLWECGE